MTVPESCTPKAWTDEISLRVSGEHALAPLCTPCPTLRCPHWSCVLFLLSADDLCLLFLGSCFYYWCCCSAAQLCPTLGDPVDCSMPGFPIFIVSQSLLKLVSIESVMPSNHLILCRPLVRKFKGKAITPQSLHKCHYSFH